MGARRTSVPEKTDDDIQNDGEDNAEHNGGGDGKDQPEIAAFDLKGARQVIKFTKRLSRMMTMPQTAKTTPMITRILPNCSVMNRFLPCNYISIRTAG